MIAGGRSVIPEGAETKNAGVIDHAVGPTSATSAPPREPIAFFDVERSIHDESSRKSMESDPIDFFSTLGS